MSKHNKESVEESDDEDTALCPKPEPEEQSSSDEEDYDYTTYHDKSETEEEDEPASAEEDAEEERKRHEASKARILERKATPPCAVEEGAQDTEDEEKKTKKSDKRREHSKHRSHKSDSALVCAESSNGRKGDKKKDKKKKTHHRHKSEPGKREEQEPQTAKKVVRKGTPALVPPEVLEEMSREDAECSDQELQEATKKNTALNAKRRNSVSECEQVHDDDDEEDEDDDEEEGEESEEEKEGKTESQGYFLADDEEEDDEEDESEDGAGRKKSELVLPPGWEVRVDKRTGNKFYVDHNTRTTQWDPPKEAYFRLPLDFGFPDPKIAAQLYLKHGKSSSGKKSILKPTSPAPRRGASTASRDDKDDDDTAVPITQDFVKDLMLALHCAVTMSVALFIPDGSTTATAASTLPIPMPYEDSYYEPKNVPRQHNPHHRDSCSDAAEPVDLAPLSKEEEELRLFYTTHSHRVSRPGSRVSMIVKDYAPDTFEVIRQLYGIGHQAYLQHWAVPRFPRYTRSRRSKIVMCDDESLVLKTLSHNEAKVLFAVLPDYARYIVDNPHTTLTKVFGLHRLHKGHDDTYFAVMANATTPLYNMVQYDLKGAVSGRKPARRGHKLKDADLAHNLVLAEDTRARLVEQLESDVRFLCDHSLMNYSLLLGVYHADDKVALSNTTKCSPDSAPKAAAAAEAASLPNPVRHGMKRWNSLGFVEETYGPQFQNVPKHLTENARHSLEMPQASPQPAPAPVRPHEIDFFDDDDDDDDDDDEDELFDDDDEEEEEEEEKAATEEKKKEEGETPGDEQTAAKAQLDMWMNIPSASDQQELYCVGVIDFFTVYSTSTKLSALFRSVSTPSAYAARFMEMVRTRFQAAEEEPQIALPTPKKAT